METKAKWTFMVYLAGDNNLSAAGDADLAEMRSVGSTADVNVVAQFDNAGNLGTNRYKVMRGGMNEAVMPLNETDSGDPKVLLDFISWVKDAYPAERYALVLWNHGSGWEPGEMDRIAVKMGTDNYSPREAGERSASHLKKTLFRTSLEKIFRLPSAHERAICSDDSSGHSLDTIELSNVLTKTQEMLGQKLDLLGMDACLMCNLEVAYQARSFVNYIVASEESEPNQGWPYDAVLRVLVDNPHLPTVELAANIVQAYIKSYQDRGYSGDVTQSALDLDKVDMVAVQVDRLAQALLAGMPEASQEIWKSQRHSTHFYHKTLWDIAHFCEQLEQLTQKDTVRRSAFQVRKSLQTGPGNFVLAESHLGAGVKNCGGLSIYLPISDLSRYYDELAWFNRYPNWGNLLKAYLA